MAFVFRPTFTRDGKAHKGNVWHCRYRAADGALKAVSTRCHDKGAALSMARDLERHEERIRAGLADPHEEQAKRPLGEHLSDFETVLSARDRTDGHVRVTASRIRRVLDGCRMRTAVDLRPARVETFLGELRRDGLSAQSATHYVRAVKQFSAWLVRDGRIAEDPLASLSAACDVEADRRLLRRALDTEEQRSLLASTEESSEALYALDGAARAWLYRVALGTGLRSNELASLCPRSFDFETEPPTVTIEAKSAKNRKRVVLPLRSELGQGLRAYIGIRPADAPVWPGRWSRHAAAMLRGDLAAAGIPFEVDGRRADFHSLRATFCTSLAVAGVPLALAQRLMRHSDPRLTSNVYTRPELVDLAGAVNRLPDLTTPAASEAARATGTGGEVLALRLAPQRAKTGESGSSGETPADADEEPRNPRNSNVGEGMIAREAGGRERRRPDLNRRMMVLQTIALAAWLRRRCLFSLIHSR